MEKNSIRGIIVHRLLHAAPAIVGVLVLVPFALGTSPLPPPYFRYDVNGTVRTPAGAPVEGIMVVLYARTSLDSALRLLGSTGHAEDLPLGVTNAEGFFALSGRTNMRADSLSVGMIPPGKAMLLSPAFHPDSALSWAVKRTGTTTDGRGCSGCGTGPSAYEYIEYYRTMVSHDAVLP